MQIRKGIFLAFAVLLLLAGGAAADERDILAIVAELGAQLEWNPLRDLAVISIGDDRLILQVGTPMALVNYRVKVAIDSPIRRNGAVWLTEKAIGDISDALAKDRLVKAMEQMRVSYILIDPGHGGKDSGAVGFYESEKKKVAVKEKDVVLRIALELSELLKKAYPDKTVMLTRGDDTYLSLEQRSETANALLAKTRDTILYVSIHANSTLNRLSKATGFEVWHLPPEYRRILLDQSSAGGDTKEILPILNSMLEEEISVESIVLAREILGGLDSTIGNRTVNRGLREESWYVVRNAKMPAVLVEVGFISSADEAACLASTAYLKDVALGMYNGIGSFISRFERNGSTGAR